MFGSVGCFQSEKNPRRAASTEAGSIQHNQVQRDFSVGRKKWSALQQNPVPPQRIIRMLVPIRSRGCEDLLSSGVPFRSSSTDCHSLLAVQAYISGILKRVQKNACPFRKQENLMNILNITVIIAEKNKYKKQQTEQTGIRSVSKEVNSQKTVAVGTDTIKW
jgi:hypothetical protein